MNEIEAVGINADETDDFVESANVRDQSRDADDCKKTTRARSEIAEDVGDAVVIEFQRERIQNHAGDESRAAQKEPFHPRPRRARLAAGSPFHPSDAL